MKLYRKIIHPYQRVDGKAKAIPEFKGRWFDEDLKTEIRRQIFSLYKQDGENLFKWNRRFDLQFEERYIEVNLTSSMDSRIETKIFDDEHKQEQ